ncbi:putative 37S ribosomal protein S18, mitochondrial [Hypsizygus marmoreus]|uniref:37S ribosomal protein S18, mitochondrial n=1 Tax=Hypsizygus marmoreus TaxID=39966 RepID=A0A369JP70_HYPMA|nr:putative 37S ribosomal protein S18, mitochondrial [Hypsizygus marmoreus]
MFALRASRSRLLVAARRPTLVAHTSLISGVDVAVTDLIDNLNPNPSATPDSKPPTAGPEGYPPPAVPNPFNPKTSQQFAPLRPKYRLHCKSTRNNTITTLTLPTGQPVAWFSGGSCGFKKVNRSSYEAGYQCAVRMFKKIEEIADKNSIEVDLFFKGFGQGRDALHRALMTSEGEIVRPLVTSMTDRTPIKIGGTRAKKARRL